MTSISEGIKKLEQKNAERSIMARDSGCIFCQVNWDDFPSMRYLPSPQRVREMNGKPYAICDWHYKLMTAYGTAERKSKMTAFLTGYLSEQEAP